jgi:protease I
MELAAFTWSSFLQENAMKDRSKSSSREANASIGLGNSALETEPELGAKLPILSGLKVAAIVTDGFEEPELVEPVDALVKAGAHVDVISPKAGTVQAFRHHEKGRVIPVARLLHDVDAADYDALLLPGGALNADALRVVTKVQLFVREFQDAGKPIAIICHAPWILVSADLVRGRKLTSYHTIQDDIRNAGGTWLDQEVVVDGNWVTSRQPSDLPAFNQAMIELFAHAPAHH